MNDFRPVDHKDSDAEYSAEIRKWVEQRAGCALLNELDPNFLVGKWNSSIDFKHSDAFDYEFFADGTYHP